MNSRKGRSRGAVRQLLDSGLIDAYRLDAAAVLAFTLIGVTVYKTAPALLWAYAGVVILVAVLALGKTMPPPKAT